MSWSVRCSLASVYNVLMCLLYGVFDALKEHVPNIFMSFDKYLFLEVINILI